MRKNALTVYELPNRAKLPKWAKEDEVSTEVSSCDITLRSNSISEVDKAIDLELEGGGSMMSMGIATTATYRA